MTTSYGKDNQDLEQPEELHGVPVQAASDAVYSRQGAMPEDGRCGSEAGK